MQQVHLLSFITTFTLLVSLHQIQIFCAFSLLSNTHPHSRCVKGESYNYSVLLWQDGSSQPFHMEGPFLVTSCKNTLDLTVHGLRKSQHYTAAVVAYNDHISLRSKRVDVCECHCVCSQLVCSVVVLYCRRLIHLQGIYMTRV